MMIRTMGTALALTAATMVLSGASCTGGGEGSAFVVQTWSAAAPNTSLAEFFDEAAIAEKISVTQHTGTMTLSDSNPLPNSIDGLIDFLFFGEDPPDLEGATLEAIADGSDKNPARFRITDTADNDFIFRIDSTGNLEMMVVTEEGVDPFIQAIGVKDLDADLDVGDDIASLFLSAPGVDGPVGALDFMAVVAWAAIDVPDDADTELTVDFGVGHTGLVTPEEDMPVAGDAVYAGTFVGVYVEPGEDAFIGLAEGDALFTADFGDGTVEGGVNDIIITDVGPVGDIDFDAVTISGNTFSGSVVPGEEGFADFGDLSTGTLDGNFYGPVVGLSDGPEEAGVVLTLQDSASDDFVTGAIGADLVD